MKSQKAVISIFCEFCVSIINTHVISFLQNYYSRSHQRRQLENPIWSQMEYPKLCSLIHWASADTRNRIQIGNSYSTIFPHIRTCLRLLLRNFLQIWCIFSADIMMNTEFINTVMNKSMLIIFTMRFSLLVSHVAYHNFSVRQAMYCVRERYIELCQINHLRNYYQVS